MHPALIRSGSQTGACTQYASTYMHAHANTHLHKTIHLIMNQSLMAFPLNESGVFIPAAVYKVSKNCQGRNINKWNKTYPKADMKPHLH